MTSSRKPYVAMLLQLVLFAALLPLLCPAAAHAHAGRSDWSPASKLVATSSHAKVSRAMIRKILRSRGPTPTQLEDWPGVIQIQGNHVQFEAAPDEGEWRGGAKFQDDNVIFENEVPDS